MALPDAYTQPERVALLEAAIRASALSDRQFAAQVLGVNERTVRYWLSGERPILGPVLQLCRLVVEDPHAVRRVLLA